MREKKRNMIHTAKLLCSFFTTFANSKLNLNSNGNNNNQKTNYTR